MRIILKDQWCRDVGQPELIGKALLVKWVDEFPGKGEGFTKFYEVHVPGRLGTWTVALLRVAREIP